MQTDISRQQRQNAAKSFLDCRRDHISPPTTRRHPGRFPATVSHIGAPPCPSKSSGRTRSPRVELTLLTRWCILQFAICCPVFVLIFEYQRQYEQKAWTTKSKTRRVGDLVLSAIFAIWTQYVCWEPVLDLRVKIMVCEVLSRLSSEARPCSLLCVLMGLAVLGRTSRSSCSCAISSAPERGGSNGG